jgi:hypothetical protein
VWESVEGTVEGKWTATNAAMMVPMIVFGGHWAVVADTLGEGERSEERAREQEERVQWERSQ